MAECNKQRLSDEALNLIANATRKGQDLKFNNLQITTNKFDDSESLRQAFVDLFSDDMERTEKALQVLETSILSGNAETSADGRFDIKAKMGLIFKSNRGERGVLNILNKNKDKDADTLVEDTIGMQLALDAIQSERDTQANSDVAEAKLEKINETGIPTSLLRLAPVIGRSIAMARGKVLNGSPIANHAAYSKKGMEVIERLIAEDLLIQDDHGMVVMGAVKTAAGVKSSGLVQTPAIRVNEAAFKDFMPATTGLDTYKSSDLLGVLKQLSRITHPYTELAPKNEADDKAYTSHEKFQTESTTETIKKVQKGELQLAPSVKVFMDYLHDIYLKGEGEKSFQAVLKDEFGADNEYEFLSKVFGINAVRGTFADRSEKGKEISRIGPLIGLMQNYSTMNVTKFFVTYNQAHNSRFFQRENILDFQADKKMARQILESTHEYTYAGDEIDALVARVGIEFGLPREVIKGENTDNKILEDLLRLVDKADEENGYESQRIILQLVSNPDYVTGIDSKNPWEIHKALRAVSDIRKGLASADGTVKTNLLLESDAAGSGPVLKLLQNIHKKGAVIALKRLGLIDTTPEELESLGGPLNDFYQLAQETFEDIKTKVEIDNSTMKSGMVTADKKKIDTMYRIMEITGHGDDFRSFIKDPIIRFTYEQTQTENIKETAKLLAESIVLRGYGAVNDTIDALDIKYPKKDKDGKTTKRKHFTEELTLAEQEEAIVYVSRALQKDVASFMVKDVLNRTYSEDMFDGTKVTINKIFDVIQKEIGAGEKDGGITYKFMEPARVLEWLDNNPGKTIEDFPYAAEKKYRLIGDKRFDTQIGRGETAMMANLYHANQTSAHILPIHAMDSAILIRAIARLYNQLKDVPEFKDKNPEEMASMLLVHDAIILPPKLSDMVEAAYEQEIINVSMNYDVVYMMLQEAAFKASLKEQEAAIKQGHTDTKFKMMDLQTLALKYPNLKEAIQENERNRKSRKDVLNKNSNGEARTSTDEDYKVIPYSFATKTSETEFTKVRDPNVLGSKDGVDAGYYERIKKQPKNVKKVEETKPLVDTATNKEISVDFNKPINTDAIEALEAAMKSDKGVIIFDTEATGKDARAATTEPFEFTFMIRKDGKDKTYSVRMPISDNAVKNMTSGFRDFYKKVHSDTVGKALENPENVNKSSKVIAEHINNPETLSDQKAIDEAVKVFNEAIKSGMPIIAHNAQYDVNVLKKVEGLDLTNAEVHDTRESAYVVRRNELYKAQKEGKRLTGKSTPIEYIANITRQEDLVEHYKAQGKAIDEGTAHTAEDDVKVLSQLIDHMIEDYKANPVNATLSTPANVPGSLVRDQATGEFVEVGSKQEVDEGTHPFDEMPIAMQNAIIKKMTPEAQAEFKALMLKFDKQCKG